MNTIRIHDVISRCDALIHGDDVEATVQAWNDARYTDLDSDVVAAWCEAKCFDADSARALETAGVTPQQASETIERCGYRETLAYVVSNHDISVSEAVELVSSW